ncbi:MAG: hypothetical protein ACYC3X_15400 [Pirellulaceae bacterium]
MIEGNYFTPHFGKDKTMCHDKYMMAATVAVAIMEMEGFCLDFSIGSLDIVDSRIEMFRQEGESSASVPATMTAHGFYVGEVIRRTLGHGRWFENAEGYRLEIGGLVANPIGKCMKRLDNGACDSVRVFAEVSITMANMSEHERENNLKEIVESEMPGVKVEVRSL